MKGLQRKCLVASAVTHGLVFLLLIVGSAFLPQHKPDEGIAITLVDFPDIIIDEPNMAGGGNPRAGTPTPQPPITTPLPAPAPVQPQQPSPTPPKAEVKTETPPETKPQKEAETAQINVPETPKFNFEAATKKAPPTKTEPTFDFNKAEKKTIKPGTDAKANSASENENSASSRDTQMASAVGAALSRLRQGPSTSIGEIGIPGPGGPSYASYNLVLRKFYEDAWQPPTAGGDNEPIVEVEVTIAKDGTVLSSRITKRGGKRDLDNSVQKTLDRVKKVPPFPSGSKDEKRTFRINFNLSNKPSTG